MSKRGNREGVFTRLFVLYLSVILLPIVSIFFVLIVRNANALTNERLEKTRQNLSYVQSYLDSRLSELSAMGTLARDNRILHATYRDKDSYSAVEIVNELIKYRQSNSILDDVFLVYGDKKAVYASTGTMTADLFMNSVFYGKRMQYQELFPAVGYFISSQPQDDILYVYPVIKNAAVKSSLIFQIDKGRLFELTDALCKENDDASFIAFYGNGNILYSNAGPTPDLGVLPEGEHARETAVIRSMALEGEKYDGVTGKTLFNWSIVMLVKAGHSFWEICIKDQALSVTLFALLFIGAIVAFRIALSQSRPIAQLAALDGEEYLKRSSLQSIADNLVQKRSKLLEELNQHKQLSLAQFVTMLFCESASMSYEQIRHMAQSFGMPEAGCFMALYLQADSNDAVEQCKERLEQLEQSDARAIAVPVNARGALGILLYQKKNADGNEDAISLLYSQIRESLSNTLNGDFVVGQGERCANLLKTGNSFSQAQIAAEYRISRPHERFIAYDSIKNSKEDYTWHHLGDIVRFCDSIRNRQKAAASDILITLMDDIRSVNSKPIIVKSMCSELIIHFIRTAADIQSENRDYLYLFNYSSLDSLERNLLDVIDELCMEGDAESKPYSKLYGSILDFINSNLNSYELSLELVSDSLGYSKTHISRVIRETTGRSFNDLVSELRIQYVCDKLKNTDLPISEIVMQAGYSDQSSFTRKFKKRMGITPGEYRKTLK